MCCVEVPITHSEPIWLLGSRIIDKWILGLHIWVLEELYLDRRDCKSSFLPRAKSNSSQIALSALVSAYVECVASAVKSSWTRRLSLGGHVLIHAPHHVNSRISLQSNLVLSFGLRYGVSTNLISSNIERMTPSTIFPTASLSMFLYHQY